VSDASAIENKELRIGNPLLEACVDSVERAILAEENGAHRLELCVNLHLDGTTPDPDLIQAVLQSVNIPLKVMIRPRGGDFVYSAADFDQMVRSIHLCKSFGIPEVATGILRHDRQLDLPRISRLAEAAAPMSLTIHKCIDMVPDVLDAIARLKTMPGVTHILSSGQTQTAWEGRLLLQKMGMACNGALTLIVAGKVTRENLQEHITAIGAQEYHGRRIV